MSIQQLFSFFSKTVFAFLFFAVTAQAATFTVTNTNRYDSWQAPVAGSLRKALEDAAAAGAGSHSIVFDFTALGANPVFAFTGDEYISNTSSFKLTGTNITLDGLTGRPVGGSVTFTSAPYDGRASFFVEGTNNTVQGITFTSTTATFVTYGLLVTGTGHNIQQNRFINGTGYGLRLQNTTNVSVKNNLFENNGIGGIIMDGNAHGARIGGCAVNEGNTIIRNGNAASIARDDEGNGITLGGQFSTCTATAGNPAIIAGNYIGTNPAFDYQDIALNFLGNSHHGISMWQSSNVTVGGACPNYVSNNGFRRIASGISVYASNAVTVSNNIVGTDGTTGKKLGNNFDGILIHAANGNTVTNNIVGNSVNGIAIRNSIGAPGVQPVNNIISNNKIGIDNTGHYISNNGAGISLENNAANNVVESNTIKSTGVSFSYGNGQTNPPAGAGTGIWLVGNTAGNQGNSVFLNTIGRQSGDPVTANNVGNAVLIDRSTNNLIGDLSKGNLIGSNGTTSDIVVDGASTSGNKIIYNQFVCSGLFATKGIELINSGNNNFGKPSAVFVDMSSSGTITGGAPANSTVHVYSRTSNCNQCISETTGNYSRGNTLLGIVTATAGGTWSFVTAEPATNIVVTATSATNNTSEFSYCYTPLGICPTAAAGPDQTLCNVTTATLAGNDPSGDGGTGAWTTISGTGVATTPASPTSGVTGLTVGASTTFRWTVTKSGCTTTSDDIIITISAPATSNAGTAFSVCNSTTATLAATVPSPGTGAWTTTAGTGVVTTPGSATSGVTNLTVGASSTFQWTVTNGACTANSTVTVTSNAAVTSNAGTAFSVCNLTTATLAATVPSVGTGAWTTTAGTGVVTTPGSATSGVTNLTVGASSTFQWTVTNGACTANSTVTITSSAPVTSDAGLAQEVCSSTTATLAATVPSPGTGAWTTTAGTGVVTTPGSATSGVTNLTVGASSTFQWTVTNGACSANSTVTVTSNAAVTSTAGTAQDICNVTTATLAATAPSVGTGAWTTTAGTGVVTTPGSATSGVTNLTVGASSTFQWTVTNGACTANSTVTITVSSPIASNAGTDQEQCGGTTATLAGNDPAPGTGLWTRTSGTGTVTSPTLFNSGVTGLTSGSTSTFQWVITNGSCISAASTVSITVISNSGTATSTQNLCNTTTSSVTASGTGSWSTLSGTGLATTPNSPTSAITSLTVGGTTVMEWTISGGACDGLITERVTINVSSGTSADAGISQELCGATTATLNASGAGTWSVESGTGVIAVGQLTNPNAPVTGLTVGASTVFKWTVVNGACSGEATVSITSTTPPLLNGGSDFASCLASNQLNALNPGTGYTGTWSSTDPNVVFSPSANAPNAVITGLSAGTTTLTWTVNNLGGCTAGYVSHIHVEFGISDLGVELLAPSDTACLGTPRTLVAVPRGGSGDYGYTWVSNLDFFNPRINGPGVIVEQTLNNVHTVNPLYEKNLYWVIVYDRKNRGCTSPLSADTLYAVNGQDLNIPNLITPNEDGKNDYWVLRDRKTGQEILPGSRFDLYNRWGQRVFTMDSYDNRFRAEDISDGTYYYYVKSGCGGKEHQGWLQILGNTDPQ